uniref:Voltage-dependent calcium channel alpha-2/delta subunit conserved region domain-containing protein n=1 Tax=Astyanax mexicanus TaxID=7994 RepID=A0A8B9GSN7_ASTMX
QQRVPIHIWAYSLTPIHTYTHIHTSVGKFFGQVDGSVMSQLLRMGMFKRISLYDYQAMCKVNPHSSSSARPLLSVSV